MKKIAFPMMGDYGYIASYFFSNITKCEVVSVPITNKTIEIGNKYSPEFVCIPFKYTLGTLIECLDKGADILVQAGGGCRYGYYFELQEKILKDLGYNFTFVNLVKEGKTNLKYLIKEFLKIEKRPNIFRIIKYLIISRYMIKYMDNIDDYIRKNIGFEEEKDSFIKLKNKIIKKFIKVKSLFELKKIYKKEYKNLLNIKVNKPSNCLRVGIIGELYTVMEPFSNYYIEKELAKFKIEVTRFTNVEYLLFKKKNMVKKYLKNTSDYVKYKMGADAMDNIARAKIMCLDDYDGIIHIKSSFCTPEIGAMPIINKVCKKYEVPVLFFSFDANTSETGIKTRLEAFYDMIEMRRKSEKLLSRD